MQVLMQAQFRALVAALVLGVLYGVLYDAVRVLLVLIGARNARVAPWAARLRLPALPVDFATRTKVRLPRTSAVLLFVLEFIYALLCGILFMLFAYVQNDGTVRFYYLVCAAVGFSAYYLSIGRFVMAVTGGIAFFLRVAFFYFSLAIFVPMRFLLRLTAHCLGAVWWFLFLPIYDFFRRRQTPRLFSARHIVEKM